MRALAINSAFIRFVKERKAQGLSKESLTIEELTPFFNSQGTEKEEKNKSQDISEKEGKTLDISALELDEIVVKQTLKELD